MKLKIFIGIGVSLLFLFLTFRKISLEEVLNSLKQINLYLLLFAVFLQLIGFFFRTLRWQRLLFRIKKISVKDLFPVLSIGYMANNVFPLRFGELARAYVLGRREGVSKSSTLATVLIERVFDGLALLFFIVVLTFFISSSAKISTVFPKLQNISLINNIALLSSFVFVGAVVFLYGILNFKNKTLKIINFFLSKFPEKIKVRCNLLLGNFIDGLEVIKVKKIILEVFLLSMIIWLLEAGMFYFTALSFGVDLPFWVMIILTSVVNIGVMIPSGPGYIGTFEFFVKEILVLFSIIPSIAVSYSLIVHLAQWFPITVIGVFYLYKLGLSLRFKVVQ